MHQCTTHDATFDPDCFNNPVVGDANRPAYCDEPWRYVDAEKCGNSSHVSYRSEILISGGGAPPSYSYTACGGDASSWLDTLVAEGLRGKVLKAGIPAIEDKEHYLEHPVTGHRLPGGPIYSFPAEYKWKGLWIEYYEEIAKFAGFEIEYVPVTRASYAKFSSEWTACAHDVAIGYLDLCIGNFWITGERIAATGANFLIPTSQEQVRLLHYPYEVADVGSGMWAWMRPFKVELWIAIVISWLIVGITYYFLSGEYKFTHDVTVKTAEDYEKRYGNRSKLAHMLTNIVSLSYLGRSLPSERSERGVRTPAGSTTT